MKFGKIAEAFAVTSEGDVQARYLEADIAGLRVASIYLPNGNPTNTEKFPYKLGWMDRLQARAVELLATEKPVVLAGDYNIIPEPIDAKTPANWLGDALFQPESRAAFRRILGLGFTDCLRATTDARVFTFWDYQAGCWQRDEGIRIDHVLASPQAADRLVACGVDKHVRGWDKPSDHVPVWCDLALEAA